MDPNFEKIRLNTRRHFLKNCGVGLGSAAFWNLLNQGSSASELKTPESPLLAKAAHFAPKAKRVIFLCMPGGPAHLDTFDYKPQTGKKEHPGSAFQFSQHGESGLWISELFPEVAKHAAGAPVKKVIVVPGRLVNVVV